MVRPGAPLGIERRRRHAAVGAPVTWVLSSHDAVRPVTRYAERRARARAAAC